MLITSIKSTCGQTDLEENEKNEKKFIIHILHVFATRRKLQKKAFLVAKPVVK